MSVFVHVHLCARASVRTCICVHVPSGSCTCNSHVIVIVINPFQVVLLDLKEMKLSKKTPFIDFKSWHVQDLIFYHIE